MTDKMIIFDLDGTLWDSAKGVADSWNMVIEETRQAINETEAAGDKYLDINKIKGADDGECVKSLEDMILFSRQMPEHLVAQDIKNVMGKTMSQIAETLMPEADPEIRQRIFRKCETFEVEYLTETGAVLFPGVRETMKELVDAGFKLSIVSNCQTDYIKAFLISMDMGEYFIDYEEWGRTLMEKGENIKLVMSRNGLNGKLTDKEGNPAGFDAVYVGDTQGDLDATRKAGIPFVWASYGFGNTDSPDAIIKDIKELPEVVKNLF